MKVKKKRKNYHFLKKSDNLLQNDTNTFNEFENAIQVKELNKEIKKIKNKKNKNLNINLNINPKNTKYTK